MPYKYLTFAQFRAQAKELDTIVPFEAYRWIQNCRLTKCSSVSGGQRRRTCDQWWKCLNCYTTEKRRMER